MYIDTGSSSVKSSQISTAVAVARRNVRMIQGKFSTLVTKSRERLQSRGINVEDVKAFLIIMYSSPNSRDGSDTVTVVVESAKSLNEIFCALSRYGLWDYLNYYLLQSIIEELARDDNELNEMMEQYQQDLTGYILTLQIQTYLNATQYVQPAVTTHDSESLADGTVSLQQKQELFNKLSVKTNANVTDHSLSYVTNLWQSLAKQFALPQPAVILHDIAEGCIGITWLIPANLVNHITRMARETANMFAEEQILRVTLEKRCVYPMETELATEPTLLETEPSLLQSKPCPLETESSPPQSEPRLLETETAALKRKVCCTHMHVGVCEKNNDLAPEPCGCDLLLTAFISEQVLVYLRQHECESSYNI